MKNLVEEIERTEKLIEVERDRNREVIHRNSVRLGEIRRARDEASMESTKMRGKIKSSEDDLRLAMERLGEMRSEKVDDGRGSAKKRQNTMRSSVENAAKGIAKQLRKSLESAQEMRSRRGSIRLNDDLPMSPAVLIDKQHQSRTRNDRVYGISSVRSSIQSQKLQIN